MTIYTPLPTKFRSDGCQIGEGCFTPKDVKIGQQFSFAPERVIPVIFLPGIMGSNLRLTPQRQRELRKKNNIAWNMDRKAEAVATGNATPRTRQLQLDPMTTVVDVYDPRTNPTGDPKETADQRHGNVKVTCDSPMLLDDPVTAKRRQTATQKARARGWGEVLFRSYGDMLNHFEQRLNAGFSNGEPNEAWRDVLGVDPARWQPQGALPPLTEAELKRAMTNCWFPVHALGYNWLQGNGDSAKAIATRIKALMADYRSKRMRCEKVIIVTHSMAGLTARALAHPDYGNLQDSILGIVHGVMPAMGSGAAYRRMRAGFEGGDLASWVLGNEGDEVTSVLANAPGGLELLPTEAYGNGWLQIKQGERTFKTLPQNGDPYTEIYMLKDKWYGLIKEEWINPAMDGDANFDRTKRYLYRARDFHRAIANTYHPLTHAHYGADRERRAFKNVVWQIDQGVQLGYDIDQLYIAEDDKQGKIRLQHDFNRGRDVPQKPFKARVQDPADPGDQTVPVHSADHQLQSGQCKAIFRQTGYEHQGSYQDKNVLACSLYSIIKIALEMKWQDGKA